MKRYLPLLVLALIGSGLLFYRSSVPSAVVVRPEPAEVEEALAVSGRVRGVEEASLAPEVSGKLVELPVAEGQRAAEGSLLARLDDQLLQAEYERALAAVDTARAQLAQASRRPLPSEVARVEAETLRAVETARADLTRAEKALAQARNGATAEQRRRLQASAKQAAAERDQLQREARRQQSLYQEGAISKQQYEQAVTAYQVARQGAESAAAAAAELEVGTRPEEVAQAVAAVSAAQATLDGAQASRRAQLQNLADQPRQEDVAVAETRVQEARKAAQSALEKVHQTRVVAPYDGVVGRHLLKLGALAGPQAPVLTFISEPRFEVVVEIDESELSRIELGQQAHLKASGFESLLGEIYEMAGEVDAVKGTLEVRVRPQSVPGWMRSGQSVDVNIILAPSQQRLLLPLSAVQLRGDDTRVLVVEEGRVTERTVRVGEATSSGFPVLEGVDQNTAVLKFPQEHESGQRVRTHSK